MPDRPDAEDRPDAGDEREKPRLILHAFERGPKQNAGPASGQPGGSDGACGGEGRRDSKYVEESPPFFGGEEPPRTGKSSRFSEKRPGTDRREFWSGARPVSHARMLYIALAALAVILVLVVGTRPIARLLF